MRIGAEIINTPLTSPKLAALYRQLGLWQDRTVYEAFANAAAREADKTAIVETSRRVSYGELLTEIDRLASALSKLGLRQGDVVALQYKNSAEMPLVHLACNRIGLLYLPLHDSWRELEIRHLLHRSKARVVMVPMQYRDFNHCEMIVKMSGELPDLEHVFTLNGNCPGVTSFQDLQASGEPDDPALEARRPHPDLPAHAMLSGGTTALSKISRFSSNNLLALLNNFIRSAGLNRDDVAAGIAPAGTGATGYVYGILSPLIAGATSVILERWGNPSEAIDLIVGNRCTYAVGIPTQLTLMLPELEKRNVVEFASFRLFMNAGAPLPYDTGMKIETLMDCVTQSIYGSTDGGVPTGTSVHDPQHQRLSTVGRLFPGFECRLVNEQGAPAASGQPGELTWRGPDKSWGYLGDDEQTAKTFTDDNFYRSGDLGQFDSDGCLRIVGRMKDMILRGGRNISPLTIEHALIRHPGVLDVSVAAVPDPVFGERACAFVILRPGHSIDLAGAVDFLKGQGLAMWQLPERLELVDDFPRAAGGKVVKAKLTAIAVARASEPARSC